MVKLKHLALHKKNKVPDHLIHEMQELTEKIIEVLHPVIGNSSPNIVLGAMSWVNAGLLKLLVVDDEEEVRKAAKLYTQAYLGDVEQLIELDRKKDG